MHHFKEFLLEAQKSMARELTGRNLIIVALNVRMLVKINSPLTSCNTKNFFFLFAFLNCTYLSELLSIFICAYNVSDQKRQTGESRALCTTNGNKWKKICTKNLAKPIETEQVSHESNAVYRKLVWTRRHVGRWKRDAGKLCD